MYKRFVITFPFHLKFGHTQNSIACPIYSISVSLHNSRAMRWSNSPPLIQHVALWVCLKLKNSSTAEVIHFSKWNEPLEPLKWIWDCTKRLNQNPSTAECLKFNAILQPMALVSKINEFTRTPYLSNQLQILIPQLIGTQRTKSKLC